MSNPDGHYKSYFRDSYDAFAIASDTHLKWIRQEGINERYQVSHASKVLIPKPSGMLSEAVLTHLDEAGEQGTKTIYLRYVDDIKILAKTEDELRRKLIKLDITAKEIGLFPQTSKINIHKISDPNEELKSISKPPEPVLTPKVDQAKIISRILELSRKGNVESVNSTRFKFVLAHAVPSFKLNSRLIKIISKQPEFAPAISSYIKRYDSVPSKLANEIIEYLKGTELYHSVNGALLDACLGRFPPVETSVLAKFCADRLLRPKKGSLPAQPSYKEALIAWGLGARALSFTEYEDVLFKETDWWVQKCAIRQLNDGLFGSATYGDLINKLMRTKNGEVSRIAAARLLQESIKLRTPYGDVEGTAKRVLKVAGVIRSVGQPESRINEILSYILVRHKTGYKWKEFFGKGHRHAELMMIFLKRNRETNIDAFLVGLDSYADLITSEIWRRLKPSTKTYPSFGQAVKDATLITALPTMMATFSQLHDLRLQSTTAHPRTKEKPGKPTAPTRRLKHRDFYKMRSELTKAFDEFERVIIP